MCVCNITADSSISVFSLMPPALQVTTQQALEALQREASKQVQGGLAAEEEADLKVRMLVYVCNYFFVA